MKHILVTIAIAVLPLCVYAQTQRTDSILSAIETNNTTLQMARNQGMRTVLELKAQNSLEETEIEYSPFFTRGVSGLSSSELIVSQSFALPWVYTSQSRLTRMQASANEAAYTALRQDILLQARNLLIEIDGLRQANAITSQRLAIADSVIDILEKRLTHGDISALDISIGKVERMSIAKEQIEMQTALAKATTALTALNGGKPLYLPTGSPVTYNYFAEQKKYYDFNHQPDTRLAAADAVIETARQRERVAKHESLPTFKLGYRRNTDTDMPQNGMIIGARIPLFSNQKRRTIARHEREEAELQRQQTATDIAKEQAILMAELKQAEETLKVCDTSLIDHSLSLLKEALNEGEISLSDYLQRAAPLYEQLQDIIATRTLYLQALSSLNRGEL